MSSITNDKLNHTQHTHCLLFGSEQKDKGEGKEWVKCNTKVIISQNTVNTLNFLSQHD